MTRQRIRTSMVVRPAGDRHEREADRVAARVLRRPQPAPGPALGFGAEGGVVAGGLQQAIQRSRGRGHGIPQHVRGPVERELGADFRGVRLHTDAEADRLSRGLQATAFTTGRDVFLSRGHTDLASPSGRRRIAHELTHVAQQRRTASGSSRPGVVQRELQRVRSDTYYDTRTGVTASRKSGFLGIWVGTDGLEYEVKTKKGEATFVRTSSGFSLAQPSKPFTLKGVAWKPPIENPWDSPGGTTTLSFSPGGHGYLKGDPAGEYDEANRRHAGGYDNPTQFAGPMLPLWEDAMVSPIPKKVKTDAQRRKHFQDPNRRIRVTDSTGSKTKVITGYKSGKRSRVVLGHKESAGAHFNRYGHAQRRYRNLRYNKTLKAYHALEDKKWSAQSGSKEARYRSPRPDRGSHRSYFDPKHKDFSGGPWHTYKRRTGAWVVDFIEERLDGVSKSTTKDPEHIMAMQQLGVLKKHYSTRIAQELLGIISKKGW